MKHLLPVLGLFLTTITYAQGSFVSPKDTIIINFDERGKKFIEHDLIAGETLYSVASYYGLSMEEFYTANPTLQGIEWKPGDIAMIPLPNKTIVRYLDRRVPKDYIPLVYRVRKGDTMYKIAKTYFRMPVEDLVVRNKMKDATLSLGQELLLGWIPAKGIEKSARLWNNNPRYAKSNALGKVYAKGLNKKKEIREKGMAMWHKDAKGSDDLYVLHRTAPINSIIAINNPMNRRTVFAKVIGKLPDNVYQDKVLLVVSNKVAEFLGAIDPKFFVNLRYLR